ncbi:hydroquinone glucosyltransferase-like [Tasmannia lanceolata]|uniref:hydroquinone glucosyltransferase-like n=1 Tax=Tasmannia lanceolata TaxID=3420 RepID=UPI0040649237
MEEIQLPHIAILPSPGMGHLIPLAELARQLVLHHNFSVTFINLSMDTHSQAQDHILSSLPKTVNTVSLPPVSSHDFPNSIVAHISLTITRSLSSLSNLLQSLKSTTRLVALVVDLFGTETFDLAREIKVPPFIFFTASSMALCHILNLPKLDVRDLPQLLKFPGCIPIHTNDLPDAIKHPQGEDYKWTIRHGKRYKEATGILINSFLELEPETIKALKEELDNPTIYPVGPVIRTGSTGWDNESEGLKWLNEQPRDSVLFISFGSGGTLSLEQLNELALGLEMSEQRFLWVVRSPGKVKNAMFLTAQSVEDPFEYLPKGFLDRTKGLGLVVSSWAPQLQVLSHNSTGGFLSHCGWNSTIESITHGVPLIAWPLYAEQKMNAVMLVEDMKVAKRPRASETGVVGREEIARLVKGLIEGEEGKELRKKVQSFGKSAARALAEGGSSYKSLSEVVCQWKSL